MFYNFNCIYILYIMHKLYSKLVISWWCTMQTWRLRQLLGLYSVGERLELLLIEYEALVEEQTGNIEMFGQNCPSDTLFTGLGSNPGIRGERAAHHPSHKATQVPSHAESSDDLSLYQRVQNVFVSPWHMKLAKWILIITNAKTCSPLWIRKTN